MELNHTRAHSARMRQKVRDTTTGLEQQIGILQEKVKSLPELLKDANKAMRSRVKNTVETIFKQMKESIENVMKDDEAEEMEPLRKERDQMDDHENTPEERKKSINKSTDSATSPLLKPTQSKKEGKFSVRIRLGTICLRLTEDIFSWWGRFNNEVRG